MESPPSTLTDSAFNKFLARLAADREQAGEQYEKIRQALLRLFDWRGAIDPAACADETLNRVIRKISEGETIRDIPTYCHGVARMVLLETLRAQKQQNVSLEALPAHKLTAAAPDAKDTDEDGARDECFQRCLQSLPAANRTLILRYYQNERRARINHRQALVAELGIPINALRNRVQRIRARIEQCVNECLSTK